MEHLKSQSIMTITSNVINTEIELGCYPIFMTFKNKQNETI
jgi:hypothetical protein